MGSNVSASLAERSWLYKCEGKRREAEGAGRKCKLVFLPYLVRKTWRRGKCCRVLFGK